MGIGAGGEARRCAGEARPTLRVLAGGTVEVAKAVLPAQVGSPPPPGARGP